MNLTDAIGAKLRARFPQTEQVDALDYRGRVIGHRTIVTTPPAAVRSTTDTRRRRDRRLEARGQQT